MELTDQGWTWKPFGDEHNQLVDDYIALARTWNKNVRIFNGRQDVGRPLAASEAQVAIVTKLHKAGKSLRWIVDETSLGLRTAPSAPSNGRINGSDRTTKQRYQKIEIDKAKAGPLEKSEADR